MEAGTAEQLAHCDYKVLTGQYDNLVKFTPEMEALIQELGAATTFQDGFVSASKTIEVYAGMATAQVPDECTRDLDKAVLKCIGVVCNSVIDEQLDDDTANDGFIQQCNDIGSLLEQLKKYMPRQLPQLHQHLVTVTKFREDLS